MDVPTCASTALLECRLCNLSFDTAEDKRQHAKGEWHVYQIRCRVAEPGTTVSPPKCVSPKPSTRRPKRGWSSTWEPPRADEESCDEDEKPESDRDTSSEGGNAFVAEECLFCNHLSSEFDENVSHMQRTHGLIIPFQSSLAVDLRTLIWFLHMVIFSYRECICCGKRRRTVEAVQQHMTSLGHCRFSMTDEMMGFYDVDSLGQRTAESLSHPDHHTLRLPSGKLLIHRSYVEPSRRSRPRERSPTGPQALPSSQQSSAGSGDVVTGSRVVAKRDRKEQALTARFAQLRTGDQMGLMHLTESQRRSLLAAHARELDKAKREERRRRGRVDDVGNKTAIHTKYYKQEVPIYMGG